MTLGARCHPGVGAEQRARRRSFGAVACWVALAHVLIVSPTFGQAAPAAQSDDLAEARTTFQEGVQLAKEEHWSRALRSFERSDALRPHAITQYNVGYCEWHLGHPTRARKMLGKALDDNRAHAGAELPADLVDAAQAYLDDAERQIARVMVTMTTGAVTVDGSPLELVAKDGPHPVLLAGTRDAGEPEVPPASTFEVQLDPGTHVFVLSVSSRPLLIANRTLPPGSLSLVELRPTSEAPAGDGATQPAKPISERGDANKPNRTPAFIALGVGATGIVVGSIGGLAAFAKKSSVEQACTPGNLERCRSEREAGNRAADISTGAFIAGGVAVGVGTVLFFAASGNRSSKGAAKLAPPLVRVRPSVGWKTLGLEGSF